MPPASRQYPTLEGWNQNSMRQVMILFDQHRSKDFPLGRPWWGYAEDPAQKNQPRGIAGELLPVSADLQVDDVLVKGWDAPWVPEPKYVKLATQTVTAGNRFRFDYERMITDRRTATVAYYTDAARVAAERNLPVPALGAPITFQLRAIVGSPPKSPKLPEAALAGDPWLLGFSPKVNDALYQILLDDQGRPADFYATETAKPAPRARSLADELMALSPDERASIAAMLAGSTPAAPPPSSKRVA